MPSKRFLLSSASLLAGTMIMSAGICQMPASAQGDEHKPAKPRIDLAFCIDTTGSMQNEIDAVKSKTKEIVAKLAGAKPAPDIRVGIVAYRDRGDDYVTKVFQFSDNIDEVVKDLSSLKADGGGDEPEAVNQALHASVNDLKWSADKKTVKLLFLIGDAEPHIYSGDYSWETESKNAIARGIQINTIACDGLNNSGNGLDVFQKIAKLAEGKCEMLTYRQEVVNAGGHKSTLISSGGKMYKVEGKAADEWRRGASTLMAAGAASAVPPSAGFTTGHAAAYGDSLMGAPMVRDFRAAPRASSRSFAKAEASPVGASAEGGGAGAGFGGFGVSRAESNLADIVLSATKDAAKKKANIDYKD